MPAVYQVSPVFFAPTARLPAELLGGPAQFNKVLTVADGQTTGVVHPAFHPRSLQTTDGQSAAGARGMAVLRGAINAESAALRAMGSYLRTLLAINAEAVSRTAQAGVRRAALGGESVSVIRPAVFARVSLPTNGQTASLVRSTGVRRGGIDAYAATIARAISATRSTVDGQAVARAAALGLARGLSQIEVLVATRAASHGSLLSVITPTQAISGPLTIPQQGVNITFHTVTYFNYTPNQSNIQYSANSGALSFFPLSADVGHTWDSTGRILTLVLSHASAVPHFYQVQDVTFTPPLQSAEVIYNVGGSGGGGTYSGAPLVYSALSMQQSLSSILSALATEVLALTNVVAITRLATNGQAIARRLLVGMARGAVDAQISGLGRVMSALRRFGIAGTEIVSGLFGAVRPRGLSAADGEVASVVATFIHAGLNFGQAVATSSAETVTMLWGASKRLGVAAAEGIGLIRLISGHRSAAGAQSPRLARAVGLQRAATDAQATTLAKAPATIRRIGNAQALTMVRALGVARTLVMPETVALIRAFSRALQVLGGASAALTRQTVKFLAAVDVQVVGAIARRAQLRSLSGADASTATLSRSTGKGLAALSASAHAMRRLTFVPLATMAASTVALGHGVFLRLHQIWTQVLVSFPTRAHFVLPAAVQNQKASLGEHAGGRGIQVGVAATTSVGTLRNTSRLFSLLSSAVVQSTVWFHQHVPLALRKRVVWLPPPSTFSAMPPSVRRVVLPREEEDLLNSQIHRAEPAYFSPFNPTDQDFFTFDWTDRAYGGDTIIYATITSIPAGVNFVGPAFVDGKLVGITIGPFSPPTLPATYLLRCSATFASGRISNYSVPFIVMNL